ncbi:hypothetical protein [Bradyrhizobium sp. JR3.5]
MECFRIDESGYTGFDVLNTDQRFQGASAMAISDEDAARLIREDFPRLQAPELKYLHYRAAPPITSACLRCNATFSPTTNA